ncbi:MAG: response regulator, partial [Bdellovibrionia bacterium]
DVINRMVDQLGSFASEVTRVSREVGTEGKLGGQAVVKDVAGTWKDLTDTVNAMAGNLTVQLRDVSKVATAIANGDLGQKITVDVKGEILQIKDVINKLVDQLSSFASEVSRVAIEVGTEGKLGGQARVEGVAGMWNDLTDNVNQMVGNLTVQLRDVSKVATAIANGDLGQKITVDVKGEILQIKNVINKLVDQLSSFASEVSRVAIEVGTEGKLGGQARVEGVAGMWNDLTDNVNQMVGNLTVQLRDVSKVATAIATGDLGQKITVNVKGEILQIKDVINKMVDQLGSFASEVTRVVREVGTEGKLGGQAVVKGIAGTWNDLTLNVNQLAQNLTLQVRAIAEVSTAVTQGDLTRSISVEAEGEVGALKDNINTMIKNLKDTTQKSTEQDWLKTNLAKLTRMLQGQKDLSTVASMIMSELAPLIEAQHGVFYINETTPNSSDDAFLKLMGSYGFKERKNLATQFKAGEGLIGQCAFEKQRILVTNVPSDYVQISSGLGESTPLNIIVLPILFENKVKAVLELASFTRFKDIHLAFCDQLSESIGIVLSSISANVRTEDLLKNSQFLTGNLQRQQDELQETNQKLAQQAKLLKESEGLLQKQQQELKQTNEKLEEKAELLVLKNADVERKNIEVEQARVDLEGQTKELALTSKYKSEFLANMSHELRTPLNSLLILSRMLAENNEGNLTGKQIEFAQTINSSGSDLLSLINEVLDLSKIESGNMDVDIDEVEFTSLKEFTERTFRHVAQTKGVEFEIKIDPKLPKSIQTDIKRLHQVIKNLLSNAFKFTERGSVILEINHVTQGWSQSHDNLNKSKIVVAFEVRDTGIGIPKEKQHIIFEAFQQADGTTSRKYGGTGLGLSISRQISHLLGGEICVKSTPNEGSTFILYLPLAYTTLKKAEPPNNKSEAQFSDFSTEIAPNPSPSSRSVVINMPELPASSLEEQVQDDRESIQSGDRVILIIEDDVRFAKILLDMAHENGFKGVHTSYGENGSKLAKQYKPDAITLDIKLPGMDGWTVLDRLKHDSSTRHIPVHVLSGKKMEQWRARELGAVTCLKKPVGLNTLVQTFKRIKNHNKNSIKNLLILKKDDGQRESIIKLIEGKDVDITTATTGEEVLVELKSKEFDCLVLDFELSNISDLKLIETIKKDENLQDIPIIIYSDRELAKEEEAELRQVAQAIIIKDVKSPERLLDATSLFLHRIESNLPESKIKIIKRIYQADPLLMHKKVLIVDDDSRNIFSLTSILEQYNMQVVDAENGKDGIKTLTGTPNISIILMDVMMPEMDGYETIRAIRKLPGYISIPIITITAKAMKGDREKSIDAGASDYITKPVDTDHLISLLRVWLYQKHADKVD